MLHRSATDQTKKNQTITTHQDSARQPQPLRCLTHPCASPAPSLLYPSWRASQLAEQVSCQIGLYSYALCSHGPHSIGDCLKAEYRLSQRCTLQPQPLSDFYEGIRAVLIDKKPASAVWNPATVHDVTAEHVLSFFAPLDGDHPRGELVLPNLGAHKPASL